MSSLFRGAFAMLVLVPFAAGLPVSHAAPVPADAGKAVTFPYPAKAPVVVQLNGIGTARDRLGTMIKTALPNDAARVQKEIDDGLKELLAGRKITAIPKDGRVFVVIHDIAALFDNTLAISFLVPVTSYKDFRESFLTEDERKTLEIGKNGVDSVKLNLMGNEQTVFAVDLKEYLAISPDKATAETYAKRYTKATTAAMAPELAKTFVTADFSVYVNFEVINELYGEQIRAFKGLIDFAFQQAPMGGMIPGLSKKQMEAAKLMLKGMFQGVEDCRGLVVGVEFRTEGLNVRVQAHFAEDTTSVQLLKAETSGPLTDVGKLPAGLGQYTGMKLSKKLTEAMRGLAAEFAPADDDEKGNAAVDKQLKELLAAGPQGEIAATGAANVSLTVANYADPKKAVAALVGVYEVMTAGGRVQNVVLKEKPKITRDARKHRGFTFTEINVAFDFDATVRDLPPELKEQMLAQIKRLVSEKMSVWVGTDGKRMIQVMAKDWNAATAALDQFLDRKKTVGDSAGYRLTRKNLPPDASYLMMMETGQTLTILADSLRAMEGAIPDFPKLGKLKPIQGEPTFIGISLTLKGDTVTGNFFVPGPAIAVGRDLLHQFFRKVD